MSAAAQSGRPAATRTGRPVAVRGAGGRPPSCRSSSAACASRTRSSTPRAPSTCSRPPTRSSALFDPFPFAAFVSKTITLAPRGGNPAPRLWEAPAGLINSIGLPNRGLAGYLERDLPGLSALLGDVPLITNVMGATR